MLSCSLRRSESAGAEATGVSDLEREGEVGALHESPDVSHPPTPLNPSVKECELNAQQ